MSNTPNVTIARGLDCSEIKIGSGFSFKRVMDLRCDAGKARPIEESVLKRLKNHFVEYEQMPLDLSDSGPCQEIHLCESIRNAPTDILLVADDLSQLAALLGIYEVEFSSNSFYIVETGKGDFVRPAPAAEENIPAIGAVAATN